MTDPAPVPPPRVVVWDLPTRLLHGLLAACFLGAFGIAHLSDDHQPLFAVHMLLGAVAVLVVLLRVVWGFVGTRHARFASFIFGPGAVLRHLRGAFSGGGERHAGHNPANAWAAGAMLVLTPALGITGALISRGGATKDLHEALSIAMIAVVVAHLAGLVLHTWRWRENIALGMIDGKKRADPTQAIHRLHPAVALAILGITGAWAVTLVRGYDPAARRVVVAGQAIQLGRGEEGDRGDKGEHRGRRHEDGHRE